ncbi:hypothetical protein OESDEN_02065 [Oesophagostomum dentatum]|uniref:Uncharacterized protein n=1 Tax=Oesophagostomum dentatum TaxID=61180 RepID=A0A0B1TRD1_OESDE|nr:hypothetical protein OESDEN_02065 [Oesophagostomum dentatum]
MPRCIVSAHTSIIAFVAEFIMGSSMGKCSYGDDPYYKRRRKAEIGDNFSKEYSEYWRCPSRKKTSDTFVIERNEFSFSNSAVCEFIIADIYQNSRFPQIVNRQEYFFLKFMVLMESQR